MTPFVQGRTYRRRDLHGQFGGQAQGGISTPAGHPFLLLFTGESGNRYGYSDGWTPNGVFEYTGEGQRGDMGFVRGNLAILEHGQAGRDLHLFEQTDRGNVRYVGQMVCTGYDQRTGPDVDGKIRKVTSLSCYPYRLLQRPGRRCQLTFLLLECRDCGPKVWAN